MFTGERLADITPFNIERYKQERKRPGVSEVTINRELAFLKNLFTRLWNGGKLLRTPSRRCGYTEKIVPAHGS
jgi:hypothetical protein